MPRQAKPRYRADRKQWFARVGEDGADGAKAVYFPRAVRTEAEAWDYLRSFLEQRRARSIDANDPSFGDLCALFKRWMAGEVQAERMSRATTISRCSMLMLVAHFELGTGRELGDLPARKLEVDHLALVLDWMGRPSQERLEGYSAHYRKDVAAAVKAMTSWASRPIPGREPRILLRGGDPLAGYRPGISVPRPARYADQAELRRFLRWAWAHARRARTGKLSRAGKPIERSEADRRYDRIFVLMLQTMRLTGARPKELRTAEWCDIDWSSSTITLGIDRHKTGKKTGRERTLYLTPTVARILRALERLPGPRLDFIFSHARGPWAETSAIDRKVREYRELAAADGIEVAKIQGPGRLVPYLSRHSFITDAILEGGAAEDVAKVVGNSAAVIQQTYDHPVKERLAERNREWAAARRKSAKDRRKPDPS
jgi:integrase